MSPNELLSLGSGEPTYGERSENLMRSGILLAVVVVSMSARLALAEATPQQELYWWQDEMREVAAEIGLSRSGQVSQWPQIAVETGAAVMPLPSAASQVTCDGKLDELAWEQATSFPVGPIFDNWRAGPFTMNVKVCRDAKDLYLAIESPRDLTELGSLTPAGGLFTVGKTACRLGPGGNIAEENVGQDGETHIIELAFPLAGNTNLTFSVENLRYQEGKLPPETAWLGLDKFAAPGASRDHRKGALWLRPIGVKLVLAEAGVQISTEDLGSHVSDDGLIAPLSWRDEAAGGISSLSGFSYCYAARNVLRKDHCRSRERRAEAHLSLLDAPLLFVKRHPYFAGHIYDDYYTWHPGGGSMCGIGHKTEQRWLMSGR
jgi:hypothetical protein